MTRRPHLVEHHRIDHAALRTELAAGLLAPIASIAPKFLYDALGSRLFAAITEIEEYYPTRTEAQIFRQHIGAIASQIGQGGTLIDLGAGNCAKAATLFPHLRPQRYVAVDISVEFLVESLSYLQFLHPEIEISGIGCDFSSQLALPEQLDNTPRTLFYPGSSIGNFAPEAAAAFLHQAHAACCGGGLLIGFDLIKDTAQLEAAYDDALGITAAFNLNLLNTVRRELGANCRIDDFRHVAHFNAEAARIEMYLEARQPTTWCWPDGERKFAAGERIHTENSHKYTLPGASKLLTDAGFHDLHWWCDPQSWFAVCWARA